MHAFAMDGEGERVKKNGRGGVDGPCKWYF